MRQLLSRIGDWISEPDESDGSNRHFIRDLARLAVRVAFLLAVFSIVERLAVSTCRLAEPPSSSSLIAACAAARPARVALAWALYIAALLAIPSLRRGWDQFEGGTTLRWFVGTITLALAWSGIAYAYNPWYDQAHAIDRLAVLALALLVFARPAFVVPFTFAFSAVIWQLDSPALDFSILIAEFRPLTNALALFASVLLVQCFMRRRRLTPFLFLALCLAAANFWVPGVTKLRIGWITHGHVYVLLPDAYTHGWLAFLSPQEIEAATRFLASFDWPMRLLTLAIECAAILTFAHARAARLLLVLWTVLLVMFFATLGYLFWKWMVLQVALLVLLSRPSGAAAAWRRDLFRPAAFVVSLLVIGGARTWFAPAALAWFDTPLADTFRYEAVGPSGATYELPPAFFAPYESHIAMGTFVRRMTPAPMIVGPYGVTMDRGTADALINVRSLDDVVRLERVSERVDGTGTQKAGAVLDELIARTVRVSNRRVEAGGARSPLRFLRPPSFLWTFAHGRSYDYREPLTEVHVYRVSSLFDGERYQIIRKHRLRTVRVTSGP